MKVMKAKKCVSHLLVLPLLAVLLLTSCARHSAVWPQLLEAEKLLDADLPAAAALIDSVDASPLRGEDAALYAILKTQADYKRYIPLASDSLPRVATDYYGTPRRKNYRAAMAWYTLENILLEYDCVFEDWKTACVSKNDHGESFFLADEGMDCVYVNNTTPHTFCLKKKNYVPLVVESGRYVGNALNNDLYLQNITYESNTVVYNSENNVYIGNHVDSSSDYGDVTIESGATLNIDFENRVVIQSGIKCKAGGKFRLNYQLNFSI